MKYIFLLFVILFSVRTEGQDSVYTLQPVEITGIRSIISPFQSSVVLSENDIIRGEQGLSLRESLFLIPGVNVTNRNNPSMGDKISIRGIGSRSSFGIRGIKIILDNIPLTMADGQTQTNNIDFFSAGSIEILKGPASSFYGNASGGVINIKSDISANSLLEISPQLILGENNLQKYLIKFSGLSGSHSYLLSFNNTIYNGFRDHAQQKTYNVNSLYKNMFSGSTELTAVVNYFNSPYLQNPGSLDKETADNNPSFSREFIKLQGSGEKADQFQGGISIDHISGDFEFETTLYFIRRNLLNPIPGRIIDLSRNAGGLRSAVKQVFNTNLLRINISAGADFEMQSDDREEYINNGLQNKSFEPQDVFDNLGYGEKLIDQREKIFGAGPFISGEVIFKERFGIISVIRYDYYNYSVRNNFTSKNDTRIMKQISPAAGILFKPDFNSRIYFNYTTSFQTPTAAELSNRPDGTGGFNQDLNPEKINQFEIGTDYAAEFINTKFSAAAFLMNFDDLLIPYQSSVSDEIFYRNSGKAINKGIEFLAEYQPTEILKISGSYSIMDFRFRDFILLYNNNYYNLDDNYVPGTAPQTISLYIAFLPKKGMWGKFSMQWNDEFYTNDFNGPPPGSEIPISRYKNNSFTEVHFRGGYNFSAGITDINIFAGIKNLFNERYNGSVVPNAAGDRYFEPSPGRKFYIGTEIKL